MSYVARDIYYPAAGRSYPSTGNHRAGQPVLLDIRATDQIRNADNSMFEQPGTLDLWISMSEMQLDYYVRLMKHMRTTRLSVDLT